MLPPHAPLTLSQSIGKSRVSFTYTFNATQPTAILSAFIIDADPTHVIGMKQCMGQGI